MKQLFKLIPLLFICISCDEIVYYDIAENKKPIFKNNDTIIFENNNKSDLDTFIIILNDEYEVYDKKYYYEEILISYKKNNEISYYERMFVDLRQKSTTISISGFYYPYIKNDDIPLNMTINGIEFPSVFIIKNNNVPNTIPKTIYYSYKHGIIRYDYSDSLFYYRKN